MISAVLMRPKMYTLRGTYGEVIAFLQGYYAGAAIFNIQNAIRWSMFSNWLSEELDHHYLGRSVFYALHDRYRDDSLTKLVELYTTFVKIHNIQDK